MKVIMKQYKFDTFHEGMGDTREQKVFYLASEVDARIAELEQENDALRLAFFQITNMAEQMRTSVGNRLKCRHRLQDWIKDGVCLMCGERADS